MTSERPALGLRQGSLGLVEYDPRWADLFKNEAVSIFHSLPGVAYDIDHIGSTYVPGLFAKPILDIAIRSEHEEQIANALTTMGYIDRGVRSGRFFIRLRDGDIRTHNLHLYHPADTDCRDQIAFRDALRSNRDLCDKYAELKRKLAEESGDQGRGEYAGLKREFVTSATLTRRTYGSK